jgi:predicted ABC-type ATPase
MGADRSTIRNIFLFEGWLISFFGAIHYTNRTYIFDNSGHSKIWLAEISEGKYLTMKTDRMPNWFKTSVWDKIS